MRVQGQWSFSCTSALHPDLQMKILGLWHVNIDDCYRRPWCSKPLLKGLTMKLQMQSVDVLYAHREVTMLLPLSTKGGKTLICMYVYN